MISISRVPDMNLSEYFTCRIIYNINHLDSFEDIRQHKILVNVQHSKALDHSKVDLLSIPVPPKKDSKSQSSIITWYFNDANNFSPI